MNCRNVFKWTKSHANILSHIRCITEPDVCLAKLIILTSWKSTNELKKNCNILYIYFTQFKKWKWAWIFQNSLPNRINYIEISILGEFLVSWYTFQSSNFRFINKSRYSPQNHWFIFNAFLSFIWWSQNDAKCEHQKLDDRIILYENFNCKW